MKIRLTAHPPFVSQKYIRHDNCMFPYLGVQTMVKHNSSSPFIRPKKSTSYQKYFRVLRVFGG